MSGDKRISKTTDEAFRVGELDPEPGLLDVAADRMADVMFDQLEYLAAHAVQGCPPGCAVCARFTQVKNLLLVPFLMPRQKGRIPTSRQLG